MKRMNSRGGTTGNRGQVAVFVALIFQVLFVFFTMVVNVGLLVHHKINLQNSVDLAAYYGAMKQAQVMNALAHVNYQIRQSWKLMTFRYRQLGMAGDDKFHPYDINARSLRPSANVDQPMRGPNGQICPTTFCLAYSPVKGFQPQETYCKEICDTQTITLLGRPQGSGAIAGLFQFPGIVQATDNLSIQLAQNSVDTCAKATMLNWFAVTRFIWSYKSDLVNRKRVFNRLANSISSDTGDLKDIDGESTRRGAFQTFFKNLTYPNQQGFDEQGTPRDGASFAFYNALGADACRGQEGDEKTPPRWAKEIYIKPVYMFRNGDCNKDAQPLLNLQNIRYFSAPVNLGGTIFSPEVLQNAASLIPPDVVNFLKDRIVDSDDLNSPDVRLSHSIAGYEKNPWCMAYIGVQASTTPRIPFTPFGSIKLVARGFAKPFGGRMGPWYYRTWQAGNPASTGGPDDKMDRNLPPRFEVGVSLNNAADEQLRGDFSRYVGDVVGTKSTVTMGQFGRSIHSLYPRPETLDPIIWKDLTGPDSDMSTVSGNGDPLAHQGGASVPMRNLELAAVIPDQFDISYYSIEPDFWRNYALSLRKRADFAGIHVRGDLGYRRTGSGPMPTMTIIDQLRTVHSAFMSGGGGMDFSNALSYTAGLGDSRNGFVEVLTSWHMKGLGDYALEPERFGQCYPGAIVRDDPSDPLRATTGNCMSGGRTGYSVKLVDGEFIKTSQPLGGVGTSGTVLNPWDDSSFQ